MNLITIENNQLVTDSDGVAFQFSKELATDLGLNVLQSIIDSAIGADFDEVNNLLLAKDKELAELKAKVAEDTKLIVDLTSCNKKLLRDSGNNAINNTVVQNLKDALNLQKQQVTLLNQKIKVLENKNKAIINLEKELKDTKDKLTEQKEKYKQLQAKNNQILSSLNDSSLVMRVLGEGLESFNKLARDEVELLKNSGNYRVKELYLDNTLNTEKTMYRVHYWSLDPDSISTMLSNDIDIDPTCKYMLSLWHPLYGEKFYFKKSDGNILTFKMPTFTKEGKEEIRQYIDTLFKTYPDDVPADTFINQTDWYKLVTEQMMPLCKGYNDKLKKLFDIMKDFDIDPHGLKYKKARENHFKRKNK